MVRQTLEGTVAGARDLLSAVTGHAEASAKPAGATASTKPSRRAPRTGATTPKSAKRTRRG
jgi:hypothetical protein